MLANLLFNIPGNKPEVKKSCTAFFTFAVHLHELRVTGTRAGFRVGVTPYSPRSELEPVYSLGSDAWDWAVSDVSTGSLIPGGLLFCPPQSWRGRGRLHNPQQQVSQFNLVATELGRFCLVTPGPRGERRHRRALHHLVSMIHERAYIEKKDKAKEKENHTCFT